jgi:hypothetical protein
LAIVFPNPSWSPPSKSLASRDSTAVLIPGSLEVRRESGRKRKLTVHRRLLGPEAHQKRAAVLADLWRPSRAENIKSSDGGGGRGTGIQHSPLPAVQALLIWPLQGPNPKNAWDRGRSRTDEPDQARWWGLAANPFGGRTAFVDRWQPREAAEAPLPEDPTLPGDVFSSRCAVRVPPSQSITPLAHE